MNISLDDIKELAEEIQYCKSKESIDQIISDFHYYASGIKENKTISQRIQTYIRLCLEKKHLLPSEKLANKQREEKRSFSPPPHCSKYKKLQTPFPLLNYSYLEYRGIQPDFW